MDEQGSRKGAEARARAIYGSLRVVGMHLRMRHMMLLRKILRRMLLICRVYRMYHRLDARHALLLRRVATWICEVTMTLGHTGQHVRGTRFFLEVRNAHTAVFFVVGTIVLLLLRRPRGLCQILKALPHAL
jgi:hypothetical protein